MKIQMLLRFPQPQQEAIRVTAYALAAHVLRHVVDVRVQDVTVGFERESCCFGNTDRVGF